MSSEPYPQRPADSLPEQFAYRFLESHGAILERTESGCNALLPEKLSALMEVPELIYIQAAPSPAEISASNAVPQPGGRSWVIHYGSALLDKMVQLACRGIPLVCYDLHFDYIKRQGFDRLVKEQFSFPNAVGRMESQAVVRTRYLLITCRYLAQSDEQKEGLVSLTFNLETGAAVPGMAEAVSGLNRTPVIGSVGGGPDAACIEQVLKQAARVLKTQIAADTAAFRESMQRRFRRDAANLQEYYAGLKEEMQKTLERPGLSAQLIAERKGKIDLIPAELRRKQDDLLKKYGIHIGVHPVALMELRMEAVKLLFRASIGKTDKTLSMIYNPVAKAMDPQVCEGCGAPTYRCTFCGRQHLLCPACAAECPVCFPDSRDRRRQNQ